MKRLSVWLKIIGGIVGLLAACAWVISSQASAEAAPIWNGHAAILTAIATLAQAVSALIDWRVAPSATYG